MSLTDTAVRLGTSTITTASEAGPVVTDSITTATVAKETGDDTESNQKTSTANRGRRKRESRRSTGKILTEDIQHLLDEDKDSDDESSDCNLPGASAKSSSDVVDGRLSSQLQHPQPDYKLLYEAERAANERLNRELKESMQQLSELRCQLERLQTTDRSSRPQLTQDRDTLDKKIADLEEQIKSCESLKADNQRLKDENSALIRVISKLSK